MTAVSILGVPHDGNSSFLRGAAEAPAPIRRELYCDAYSSWSETGIDLGVAGRLADRGDIRFEDGGDPWDLIEAGVGRALDAGGPLISLGGDHAITWPILRAVRRRHPRLTILQIDAHPDLYPSYRDNPRSHTSSFARIMEEGLADRLIQVGLRTLNGQLREQIRRFGVEAVEARHCRNLPRLDIATPVYLSVDVDALDPSCAPGVGHREPGGLTTRQVIDLIQAIGQPIVAADIVEYNPRCDVSGMTATVCAKLVKEIAGMMIGNADGGRRPGAAPVSGSNHLWSQP